MLCYRVEIPDGARVVGTTAAGDRAAVLPGEYLVHALRPKLPSARPVFRFVGADALGRDVHVPLDSFAAFLAGQTARPRLPSETRTVAGSSSASPAAELHGRA